MQPVTPLPNVQSAPRAAAPRATVPAAPAQPVRQFAAPPVVNAPLPAPPSIEAAPPEPYYEPAPYEAAPYEPASGQSSSAAPKPETAYGTFVVVTPYNSDLTLSQVQQIAPDAFVSNTATGAEIQAGIFDDAGAAQALVDQLQREGVNATIGDR